MFEIENFQYEDAAVAGAIGAGLYDRGLPIGRIDLQLAAMALRRGLIIVTHNVGEFRRVPKLPIEDWQEEK